MNELQPSVHLVGIRIQEPVTTLTDLLVAVFCFWAFTRMKKFERTELNIYVKYFFLTMGLTTLIGGIVGHAFNYKLGLVWKLPAWILSMISIALLERAAIQHARPLLKSRIGDFFMIINIIELLTFLGIIIYTLNFLFVELHAAYGLLIVVFSFEFFIYKKTKDERSLFFIMAVGSSTLAAIVHMTKFSFSKWFNFFDIGHVLMTLSCFCVYKGIERFHKSKALRNN